MAIVSMDIDLEIYCEECDKELDITQVVSNRSSNIGRILVSRCTCGDDE